MVDKIDTFAERLKFLRKKSGLSLAAVARQLSVSPQAVHKWENGGKVDNDREWDLADLFNVSAAWLIRGENPDANLPALSRPDNSFFRYGSPTTPRIPESGTYVPLLDTSEVVGWLTEGEWHSGHHKGHWIACPSDHGERTFAMIVKGVTMENLGSRPSYSEGDVIFADPDASYKSGARCLFSASGWVPDLDVIFKQLIIEDGRKYWRSLNPQWPSSITPIDDTHLLLAIVIGKWVGES